MFGPQIRVAESVSASLPPDFSLRRAPQRGRVPKHTGCRVCRVNVHTVYTCGSAGLGENNASLVLFVAPCKLITWILFIGFRNCEARGSQQYPHQHEEFRMKKASEIATYADRSKSADRMKQNPHGPSTPFMKPVNRASKRAAARGASGASRPGGAALPPTGKRK